MLPGSTETTLRPLSGECVARLGRTLHKRWRGCCEDSGPPIPDVMIMACEYVTSSGCFVNQSLLRGGNVLRSYPGRPQGGTRCFAGGCIAAKPPTLSPLSLRDVEFAVLPPAHEVTYSHLLGIVEGELAVQRRHGT